MKHKLDKKRGKGISMSLKLVMCLASFTFLAVVVVWVFQIFMSDTLYENVKNREIESTAKYIRSYVQEGGTSVSEKLDEFSEKYDMCVGFYLVEKDLIKEIHSSITFEDNVIHNAPDKMLRSVYDQACRDGGVYKGRFGFDFFDPDAFDKNEVPNPKDGVAISALRADVFRDPAGNEYLLLLNSTLTPITSAKTTFGAQFGYTIIVLIVCSVIMGFVISRIISRPLKSMSESAKALAHGKYDVEFSGGGYKEISELSDTLNYAASELAKNDHLQKELIANISHDLRTPLTMIRGYSEMMRDIPGENTPENIQAIIDETTRLSELVTDMLDLSKIESGTGKFEAEEFDITEAVNEVIGRYDKMSSVEKYNIRFDYDSNVRVYADRSMVLQVVYNLINNAINYSGEDKFVGINQTLCKDELGRDAVRISVIDHGEGIAKEELPLIWDRYYKVEKVHKRATVGTGLGLSIVKKVLERHGASYGVESTLGEGSKFWFEFPIIK